MSILGLLIPLVLVLVALAIGLFFWAVRSNQFEDLERQGHNILFDEDEPTEDPPKDKAP
ncbi:cbb3-type cytochrome oxidase assembly protein CcoS [Gallaecimonas kandeliae]|uniref:cbb3-type cytochrome oxidase assembly protein CcoS n=1 Tax=Gallaecimonas kandeliae TaxID=3029055 RepID=UPI002648ADC8|nr:cbb3-type cytochrome oxidase assembly protein CcoS [Gallaecimonas kandeliae]WKE67326.1 cbb3-type cytochrome oxidase assembly protein CcoS [Gallaecimonas kandeliae]